MAKREVVTVTDDLDPSKPADITIDFGVDGATYQIDLTRTNADRLGEVLAPYIGAARRVGGRAATTATTKAGRPAGSGVGVDVAAVKAWADSNGIAYNKRGRLPAELVGRFRAAMD